MKDIISAKHITKKILLTPYVILDLLTDANFYAGEGEFLVLTGVSGTGKSTLLRILLGYEKAEGSEIIIDNRNINEMNENELEDFRNETIGKCIPQLFSIPKNLTVKQSLYEKVKKFYGDNVEYKTNELLSLFELSSWADIEISSISEMNLYRLMLVLAFCGNPPIIIIDEVLDYFEKEERERLLKTIMSIHKEQGITLVLVTIISDIIKQADRAINIMNNTTYWIDLNRLKDITADK